MSLDKSYLVLYNLNIKKDFESINFKTFFILNPQLAVIYVSSDAELEIIKNLESVISIRETIPMSSLIKITNNLKNGESIENASGLDYIKNNPYINISGKGILIGIIDSGIDYLNPSFIDENGETKIVSIWDQEQNGFDYVDNKFIYGKEITNEEINKAIRENNPSLSVDNVGTGTICSSIIANIAKDAKIALVKLKTYKNGYNKSRFSYNDGDFLLGIRYLLDVSKKLDMPIIINLSVGAISSNIEELNLLDTFNELSNAGIFVVGGVGNEGNTGIHFEGNLQNINDTQDIVLEVGKIDNLEILLEPSNIDKISTQIISPSGEISYVADYKPENPIYTGRFNIENTSYSISYVYPDLLSGKQKTNIKLKNIKPGIWTIRIFPEFILDGEFSIYIPNKNLLDDETKFIDYSSLSTTTTYSQGKRVITVGVFNNKTDSMWLSSSKGNKVGAFIKPDIVAPGVNIISDFLNQTKNTSTGSGVSSSVLSGVCALIIEYLILQSDFTRLALYSEVIKTYLMLGATKKDIYKYPNISQGYGILDLRKTIKEISDNL